MKILQALSLLLLLIGPSFSTKITSVKKDGNKIKFVTQEPEDGKESSRISRQSSLYSPLKYEYQLIPVSALQNSGVQSAHEEPPGNEPQYITQQVQDNYQSIQQQQQEQLLAAAIQATKQPKSPVYHATPLQPYGVLLNESPEEKTVLVTPKPLIQQQESDSLAGHQSGGHSFYTGSNSVGKVTDAVIQEPKHAPLVYQHQSLQNSQHQTLHSQHDDEEPKNYAAKYQFAYQVRDPKHGTYFGHAEARDGHHTKGNYHVLLPDGRLQNVQYWADLSGYHAQVSYNAAARHPEPKHH